MIFKSDREKLIESFARHYKKNIKEVREMVERNPQILEDYNDNLVDNYEDWRDHIASRGGVYE